ncbi:hypothetical protein V495_07462 [Pseudogymnoascus sp. VKM F-4514 (FW-929)]|nr:hypothetical protein V495_07462 [Pseudogymnoascus sp. VKM F-4514 (FW-929)]
MSTMLDPSAYTLAPNGSTPRPGGAQRSPLSQESGGRVSIQDIRWRFQDDSMLPKPREYTGTQKRYRAGRGSSVPLGAAKPHRVAVQSSDKPGKATVDQSLKTATSISTSALQAHKHRATLTRLLSSASSLAILHIFPHSVSPRSFVATNTAVLRAQQTRSSTMAQIRGTAGYNLGGQQFGGPSRTEASDPSPLDAIRAQTSKIEDALDTLSEPLKPYLPAIGRFLIVVTFLEDALRIITQWSDQLSYLRDYRHIPTGLNHIFLIVNVIAMTTCSGLVITRKHSDYAVGGLIGVVVTQALGYGLIFDLNFFLRNLSVMGGLLMVLSDSWVRKTKAFAGLPEIDEKDRKMYFQLAGRVLLIFLFVGFVFSGTWSFWRVLVAALGFVACVMVVVGFKAKFSATMLVVILSIFNLLVNNFWTLHEAHPHKDFAKYDFFQILSIVGGLLLLVNSGPGKYSIDEKKKVY